MKWNQQTNIPILKTTDIGLLHTVVIESGNFEQAKKNVNK